MTIHSPCKGLDQTPLSRLLRAGVLCLTLLAAGCIPGQHEFDMPALDTEARETAILAQSSNAELLEKGRELFDAGRFDAAVRRFEALRQRQPEHLETTVRLGLALWFFGRPAQTEDLWRHFSAPGNPALEQQLIQRASALRILSYRLGARRILEDHRRGQLLPAVPESVVILPALPETDQRQALPNMDRALHFLLLEALAGAKTLQPAPRELIFALRAESGSDLPATLDQTLELARILGSDHAVTLSSAIPEDEPDVLRTTLAVQLTESLQKRAKRLMDERQRAENAWATGESQLRQLQEQQERCSEILEYFDAVHELSPLVQRRDQQAETATRLNREGKVAQAIQAMGQHRATVAELAALQGRIKDYERRLVLGMEGVRRFTPEAFRERREQLGQQRQALEEHLTVLRKTAWAAVARASNPWPAQGRSITFDVPLSELASWPSRAVERLARLTGEPVPQEQSAGHWGLAELQALDKALMAWDNGEYDDASRLFEQAGQACPQPPPHPGPGFDVLRKAEQHPSAISNFFLNDFSLEGGDSHD